MGWPKAIYTYGEESLVLLPVLLNLNPLLKRSIYCVPDVSDAELSGNKTFDPVLYESLLLS